MYKRIMLKLSGEALSSETSVFDVDNINALAKQIKAIVNKGTSVGIVVGGGNMIRGKNLEKVGFERVAADHMGMLGTTMNAMFIEAALKKNGVKALAMSATAVDGCEALNIEKARELLDEGTVVIFGGGIGNPYFSTDTATALRAIEIGAEVVFMAKNNVDGVYSADPNKDPNATRFEELTFDDILRLNLQVMDLTAATLMKDYGMKAFVFNMSEKDNIKKAVNNKAVGTIIK